MTIAILYLINLYYSYRQDFIESQSHIITIQVLVLFNLLHYRHKANYSEKGVVTYQQQGCVPIC